MMDVLVAMWLFAFGVMTLAGYWHLTRRLNAATTEAATTAERAKRTEEALAALAASMDRLQVGLLAQRKEAATLRGQISDFIDGPPSVRAPALPSYSDRRAT